MALKTHAREASIQDGKAEGQTAWRNPASDTGSIFILHQHRRYNTASTVLTHASGGIAFGTTASTPICLIFSKKGSGYIEVVAIIFTGLLGRKVSCLMRSQPPKSGSSSSTIAMLIPDLKHSRSAMASCLVEACNNATWVFASASLRSLRRSSLAATKTINCVIRGCLAASATGGFSLSRMLSHLKGT